MWHVNWPRPICNQHSRKDRKKVELLFAHLKRILKLDRLRLRGPHGAQDEFLLAATAQNLRRMPKWCPSLPEPALASAQPSKDKNQGFNSETQPP
jgi:hypothetical protein